MTKEQKKLQKQIKDDVLKILDEYYQTEEYKYYDEIFKKFYDERNKFVNDYLIELGYEIGEKYIKYDNVKIEKGDVKKW